MPVIRPSDSTAIKTDMRYDSVMEIAAWTQEYFHKSLSVSSVHPKIQVKALSCKQEAKYEYDPEALLSSLGQSSFKMLWDKVENCSVVRQIEISHSFWKQAPHPQD